MTKQPTVADYMVRDIEHIEPGMTVKDAIKKITVSHFHGFPVVQKGYLLGFITAKELLRYADRPEARIREIMKKGTVCAIPSMSMEDATRVLFRYGLRNLPVVDEDRKIVGMISNIDVVRSHIERSRPTKVSSVKSFLEKQNGIHMRVADEEIPIAEILPTQKEVFMDELIGRQYEMKRGLNEPLIVIKRRNGYLVVDGHHRAMAAKMMGAKTLKAIVLEPDQMDLRLGLERTAERWGLRSLDDVKVIEGAKHPFIQITTMLLPDDDMTKLNERLNNSN
jgi:IMP dehydrogenase